MLDVIRDKMYDLVGDIDGPSQDGCTSAHGIDLTTAPDWYFEFIQTYGGLSMDGYVEYKSIEPSPMSSSDGLDAIEYFCDMSDLREFLGTGDMMSQYYMFGCKVVPIGESPGGDLILLGLKDGMRGNVYYWYHENEHYDENGDEKLYLISESFTDFIVSLESDSDLDGYVPGKAVITLDSSFWEGRL